MSRFVTCAAAQDAKANPAAKLLEPRNAARHEQFLKIVANGEADVIFLGDSITQGWEERPPRKSGTIPSGRTSR